MTFDLRYKNHSFKCRFKREYNSTYQCSICGISCVMTFNNLYFLYDFNLKEQHLTCEEMLIKNILE